MSLRFLKRRWLGALAVLLVCYLGLAYAIACAFTWPRNMDFEDRKEIAGITVEPVELQASDGVRVSAWLVPGGTERGVVLVSGIGSNRRAMVGRAAFYASRGYTALLADLRGTGKSERHTVTIGWEERHDVQACADFLRARGIKHVGVNGISLGASAIAYSYQENPKYDFVVLESCYDALDHAWRNRLAMFNVPHVLTWPVRWMAEWRIGEKTDTLAPYKYLGACSVPTLVVAGDAEPELKVEETQRVFDAIGSTRKQLHFFKGGRHQDFLGGFEEEFKATLGSFLADVEAQYQL